MTGSRVHVAELDVLPDHGRRGVGTSLVGAVDDWVCSEHLTESTLTTYRDLPRNAPFYARLGFSVVHESDWDAETRRRFEEEAGLESERAKRVVMRKWLIAAWQALPAEGVGGTLRSTALGAQLKRQDVSGTTNGASVDSLSGSPKRP